MCRAVFAIVLVVAASSLPVPALSHKVSAATMVPPSAPGADNAPGRERVVIDKTARSNTVLTPQKHSEAGQVAVSAFREDQPSQGGIARAFAPSTSPGEPDPGRRYTLALWGTLAIIGTIAARRRTGKRGA